MSFPIHSRRGQTLVEALIALSILTVGFVGVIGLLTKSFQLNRTTSNDTQATYLAAEGIEVVKNLIDHDVYEQLSGNSNYRWSSCFSSSGYYYPIDYETTDCSGLSHSSLPPDTQLYFDPATHMFTTNAFGTNPTDFVRNIEVTNNGEELDVKSMVAWSDGGQSNTITLEDHFYNWIH